VFDVRQARVVIIGTKHRTEDMTGVFQVLYTDPSGTLAVREEGSGGRCLAVGVLSAGRPGLLAVARLIYRFIGAPFCAWH